MTNKYPEVLATADLTPICPAPLHPSSPIIVPTLQQQADTICTMTLAGEYQVAPAPVAVPPAEYQYLDPASARSDMPTIDISTSTRDAGLDTSPGHPGNLSSHENQGQGGEAEKEEAEAEEEEASPAKPAGGEETRASDLHQEASIEAHQDVSKTNNESTLSYDTSAASLTNHTEVAVPVHDLHSTSPHQLAPEPSPDASPNTTQQVQTQVQKPQEEEQVGSYNIHEPQPPQPSADAQPATSDQNSSASNDDAIDIQALVDNITARAAAADANQNATSQNAANFPNPTNTIVTSTTAAAATATAAAATTAAVTAATTTTQSSSLPPRPPMPQPAPPSYTRSEDVATYQPGVPHPSAMPMPPAIPPAPGTYPAGGAPGTVASASANLPTNPPPPISAMPNHAMSMPQYDAAYAALAGGHAQALDSQQQRWENFLQEERRYVSEAKWDRFPEGSRLFIGNLSSERVSKKEVFDIFSKFGRLAQISLKQAYGFVQYHTVVEGQAAMDHLQGIEIRGRKIHLEFSRTQKKDSDSDKRGNRGKRDSDRHDGGRGRRDDYRPSRQPSPPRRGSHRQQNSYDSSRSRSYYDGSFSGSRGRSRSPSYGGRGSDPYRRRSPSPYRRQRSESDLDMPRRYGGEIPDVQFLLLQDVERDFVGWAERAFVGSGLKVHVMFLNPQFPRDAVIQRQVMEGVHAVVELDFRAQQYGKLSLQLFDRSAGHNNVRYDQYQDLDPHVAAQLVVRAKSQAQLQSPYGNGHFPPVQQYPPAPQQPYMPPSYANQPYANPATGPGSAAGSLDSVTLQKILGSLQGQPGARQVPGQPMPPTGGPPVDMNAILAGFGGAGHNPQAGPPPPQHGMPYAPLPPSGGNSAQHVENIMAQLSRYRQ
ncbi:hypothetical protein F4810DRAFT_230096 [Camillea tinctor]|nr:hypothetical protein F4810DRAFT_230096 [Camillea tinctor]